MMNWLATLTYHNYEVTQAANTERELMSPFLVAQKLLDSESETLPERTDKDRIVEDVG